MKPCPWCGTTDKLERGIGDVVCRRCNAHGPDRRLGMSAEETWDSRGGTDLTSNAVASALCRVLSLVPRSRDAELQADLTLLYRLESKLLSMP